MKTLRLLMLPLALLAATARAHDKILSDEGIRKQYSDDLEAVWLKSK